MMQFESPATRSSRPGVRPPSRPERSLAVVHAAALYRPVPPFDCDDDGYPHDDSAAVENDYHDRLRAYLGSTMRARYADRDDVYVATDLGLYFEEGNRAAVVVPDLMVVLGVPSRHRLSYKLWQEPKVPDFVAEVLSERTWRRDLTVKPALYRDLGVPEFWILDVIDKLPAPVTGMRLTGAGDYQPIAPSSDGALASEKLGLALLDNDRNFRFRDLATGEIIPDYTESEAMRKAARAEADAAHAQTLAAQAEAREARAEADAAARRLAELEERLRRTTRT